MSVGWAKQELSGWGRYPRVQALCTRPERRSEVFSALRERDGDPVLAHGLGRSYGDAALLEDGRVVLTRRLDRMLDFDAQTGWLHCESGVSLEDIIETFLPRGFFPPVVPGTQFVTVGGALGCNIHGKNHHVDGCWGDHVRQVELLTASGDVVVCDREHEPELFWATVGGMGLTGLILSMQIQLTPVPSAAIEMESIRVESLDEFFAVSRESGNFTHTVSWIDCAKRGKHMGRGIFMRGRHAPAGTQPDSGALGRLAEVAAPLLSGRPFESNWLLNRASIMAFNEAYFRRHPRGMVRSTPGYEPFFFPLDAVKDWNRVYGKRGFLQYQMVVPSQPEQPAVREILRLVSESGLASFLAVIKEFGEDDHGGLSFPMPGVTLALDFANHGKPLLELMERLDEVVVDVGGRVYLGKDARLSRENFRRMYPQWERWKAVRDAWDPERVFQSGLSRRLGLV